MLSIGICNTEVICTPNEYLYFDPLNGICSEYMEAYKSTMGGSVENELAPSNCNFCAISDTNVSLDSVSANYSDVGRSFGIIWVFIVFNIFAACALYWWVRVPKVKKEKRMRCLLLLRRTLSTVSLRLIGRERLSSTERTRVRGRMSP